MKAYLDLNVEDRPGEIWKDIPGYNGNYQVSNHGRIKSLAQKKPKIRRQHSTKDSICIKLSREQEKGYAIHTTHYIPREVVRAFMDPQPEGTFILHRDKDFNNNNVNNLHFGPRDYSAGSERKKLRSDEQQRDANIKDINGKIIGRQCTKCSKRKDLDHFQLIGIRDHRSFICRQCHDPRLKNPTKYIKHGRLREELHSKGLKVCSRCKSTKLYAEFNKYKKGIHGYTDMCRLCIKEYRETHYSKEYLRNSYQRWYLAKKNRLNNTKKENKMISLNRNMSEKLRKELVHIVVTGLIRWKTPLIVAKKLNMRPDTVYAIVRGLTYGSSTFAKRVYQGLRLPNHITDELRGKKKPVRTLQEAYTIIGGTIVETTEELQALLLRASAKTQTNRKREDKTAEVVMPNTSKDDDQEREKEAKRAKQREYNKKYHLKRKAARKNLELAAEASKTIKAVEAKYPKSKTQGGNPTTPLAKKVAKELEASDAEKITFNMKGNPKDPKISIDPQDAVDPQDTIVYLGPNSKNKILSIEVGGISMIAVLSKGSKLILENN